MLYRVVQAHWPAVRERAEEQGGLPKFVVREFEEYLRCGVLSEGCLHLACRSCGYSQIVGLSCKRRGFCPSCLGRRMADSSVHLEESVLPAVPIRHWICSLPWGLRALLGYDAAKSPAGDDRRLCAEVVSAFVGELSRSLRCRAKAALALGTVADAHTGAVTAVQRTDSALRLNVHFHVLALDGVYVRDKEDGRLVFHPLGPPTRADVAKVAARTAARIEKLLRAHGRSLDPEMHDADPPGLCLDDPGLAACYAAAARGVSVSGERAGQTPLRLVVSPSREAAASSDDDDDDPVAELRGINLHARQCVDGRDRMQLERLCRYITRPPVAQDRLEQRPDGRLELTLKSIWKDGTRAIILEPQDLVVRLIAAIPPPRFHTLRYFGVLSSHSSLRAEVVPRPPTDPAASRPPPAPGDQMELPGSDADGEGMGTGTDAPPRRRWAWLLRHVFQADLEHCPRCNGPMRWLEAATTREAAARLLGKLGLAPRPPPAPRRAPWGQLEL
ncbi:MAG TPA: transposase, partial [Anaeromyxobacteraceae bacterium]